MTESQNFKRPKNDLTHFALYSRFLLLLLYFFSADYTKITCHKIIHPNIYPKKRNNHYYWDIHFNICFLYVDGTSTTTICFILFFLGFPQKFIMGKRLGVFLVKQDVFVNKIVIFLVCYILCCKKDFFYSMGEYIILNNLILFHASLLFKFCLG